MIISHIRSLCQQLVAPQFSTAHEIVDWMGMFQAQDYASLPWAVGLRMKSPSYKLFKKDFDEGRILRVHLFRNTWQLVTSEDLRWMQMLYAERGLRGDLSSARSHGWNEDYIPPIRNAILAMLESEEYLTKEDIAIRLRTLGHKQVDELPIIFFLRRLEFEGLICSGPITGKAYTYSLTERRCAPVSDMTKEEALALLAHKYLRSHSPATLEDFVWWTGLSKTECRLGIESIKSELTIEELDGKLYYINNQVRTKGFRSIPVLLPSFDEYLIAYKSRYHVIKPEHYSKAFTSNGIFFPIVAIDGHIVGRWNIRNQYSWFEAGLEYKLDEAEQRLAMFWEQ